MEQKKTAEYISLRDKESLEKKWQKIKEGGVERFHIITDFDRTLTSGKIAGKRTASIISQLRSGNFLSEAYSAEAHKLYDHYRPIETDTSLSLEERSAQMDQWWQEHFDLLSRSGLTKSVLEQVVKERPRIFRPGALAFFDLCKKLAIPVVIMSASMGDMIKLYLEAEGKLSSNIHIVSNLLEFDEKGSVIGVKKPIVHSLNKQEVLVKSIPDVYDAVKERKNVLLMGDGLGDLGMVEGFAYDELVSVGFYNDAEDGERKEFEEAFDILISDDREMDSINEIISTTFS